MYYKILVCVHNVLSVQTGSVVSYLEVLLGEPQPVEHPQPSNGHLIILTPAQTHPGHHRVTNLEHQQSFISLMLLVCMIQFIVYQF